MHHIATAASPVNAGDLLERLLSVGDEISFALSLIEGATVGNVGAVAQEVSLLLGLAVSEADEIDDEADDLED
jgi:hypothetical protein